MFGHKFAEAILEGQTPIYERLDTIDARLAAYARKLDELAVGQAHLSDDIRDYKLIYQIPHPEPSIMLCKNE
jgi:hypothetical protein